MVLLVLLVPWSGLHSTARSRWAAGPANDCWCRL